MFLTKIWFFLLAFAAALAVTFALVAPRPVVQKLSVLEGQRLDRAQYAAEQMFKVDAHKWIDRVSKLGRDAILADSLDAASRGSGESKVIHRTVQDRFRTLIPDLASGGIDVITAVDAKGQVVARVGEGEKEYGDYIGGAELIADALRGYLSDDVWGTDGKLQRVAAAPVLSKGRDRIVGVIYMGAETGDALVERLKKNLDVDVALILRGKVIASSRGGGDVSGLPELIAQHTKEIETLKRTPALSFSAGRDNQENKLLAVAAPFPGQAGEQQAYYALIGALPARTDLTSIIASTSSDDLKWGHFPWLGVVAALAVMIGGGLFLQRFEVETPLKKLRRELQRLASGDIVKIQDTQYGGQIGGLARDVNAAIERFTHAPGARSEMAGKDLGAILGPSGGSTFDLPASESAFAGTAPPSMFGGGASVFGAPPPPSFAPPPPSFPPPPPGFAPTPPSFPPAPLSPPPLPGFAPAPSFPAPAPFSTSAVGGASNGDALESLGAPPVRMPWGSPAAAPLPADEDTNRSTDQEATRIMPYDPAEEEDAHFRTIFDEFLEKKRECGESTAGLTRDKFMQKLRDNKAALVEKHNCRTVRFSVYVKDGKAALKATPVRD